MRVLTFTSLFPNSVRPRQGVFVSERMSHVARLDGCTVKVVAPVPYCPPVKMGRRWELRQVPQREQIAGLDVYHPRYFMVPKVTMTSYGLTMFLSVAPLVRRIQREFDFDVVDAHFLYPDGLTAVLLGRFCHKPVVVTARGSDVNVYGNMPLIRRLLRQTLGRADRVIAVSRALKRRMTDLGADPRKIAVVPNGVDVGKFSRVDRGEARRALGLPGGRIVLSVGGLVPVKGFDVLIEAVREPFTGDAADTHFVIVGEGPERGPLQAQIQRAGLQDRVRLVGEVPHERLHLWYSAADLLCLPSRNEGCPNVVLEALACGTPVVGAAVGGVPEMLVSEDLGLLYGGQAPDLRRAIEQALSRGWNPEVIAGRIRRESSWMHTASEVVEVFRRCVPGVRDTEGTLARSSTWEELDNA